MASDGSYTVEGLPPGRYLVSASVAGFSIPDRTSTVDASSSTEQLDLKADQAASVSGVVRFANGDPAPNASIKVDWRAKDAPGGKGNATVAGPDGRFAFGGLGPGKVTLTAWARDEIGTVGPMLIGIRGATEVTVPLAAGAMIAGTARWDDGSPAVGVMVVAASNVVTTLPSSTKIHNLPRPPPVFSQAGGRFTLGPFLPSDIRIRAVAPGDRIVFNDRDDHPGQRRYSISAGERREDVEVVLLTRSHALKGVVIGSDGRRLAGAHLVAAPEGESLSGISPAIRETVSAPDGSFALEGLGKTRYTVRVDHPAHPLFRQDGIAAGRTDVELRLPAPARIEGLVVDRRGRPVPRFTVVAVPAARGEETPRQRSMRLFDATGSVQETNDFGGFAIGRLPEGRWEVSADTPDGLVGRVDGVQVRPGQVARVRLVMEPGATVTGRVLDEVTNRPVARATVSAYLRGLRPPLTATTDARGGFRLPGVLGPVATLRVAGAAGRHDGAFVDVAVAPGQVIDVGAVRLGPP